MLGQIVHANTPLSRYLYLSANMLHRLTLKPLALCIFLLQGFLIGEKELKSEEFRPLDRWYEVYLSKSKVGFAHSTMKLKDGEVRSESIFEIKIKRAGQVIEMKISERTRETIGGEILGFSGEMLMAGIPITKEGWVENGEIVVKEKQFSRETEKRYPLDPKGKMTWGLLKFLRQREFEKAGQTYEILVYSPDFGMAKPTRATIRTKGAGKITLGNKEQTVYETEIELGTKLGSMKTTNWLDDQGIAVRTQMNMGGLNIDIRQSSQEEAKREESIKEDFLLDTVISLGVPIPKNARRSIFRLRVPQGKLTGISYEGQTQKLTRIDEQTIEVEVLAEDWQAIRKGKGHPAQVDGEFREPNILIDSGDAYIKNLAREAGKGAGNVFQMAEMLCRFVSHYVSNKNFSVGFASASEVARKREGDCTEHGILLAALGRAMGIPSRVVTGIVYVDEFKGVQNAMVYHMWTQFFLKGRWVNFDSALGKIRCPADRIILFVSSLHEQSHTESMLPASELLGKLTVKKVDAILPPLSK
jgi:hypothetical protein